MGPIQFVLDTNIIYSGLRSKRGASYQLLSLIDSNTYEINLSVPLLIEYEDVLKRNPDSLQLTTNEIDQFLNYLCLKSNWHEVYFLWRPLLKDPEDDMILELAIRANSNYIVTYNTSDFTNIDTFGIQVVTAQEALRILQENP